MAFIYFLFLWLLHSDVSTKCQNAYDNREYVPILRQSWRNMQADISRNDALTHEPKQYLLCSVHLTLCSEVRLYSRERHSFYKQIVMIEVWAFKHILLSSQLNDMSITANLIHPWCTFLKIGLKCFISFNFWKVSC